MSNDFRADPFEPWDTSLSDRHEDLSDDLDRFLDSFESGDSVFPLAVVGPYGAGKTQYLYEVYRRSWERGIPAVYTDLKSILEGYEEDNPDGSLSEWLDKEIRDQIEGIFEDQDADWMPNFRSDQKEIFFSDYFDPSIERNGRYVLLIDEVEQKYTELDKYADTDDKNPLRDILDGLPDLFQVWSFGLVSAYEIIGEADRRRFNEARIPITDVDTVWNQLHENNRPAQLANGVWWLARGRAGWIAKYSQMLQHSSEWNEAEFQEWLDEAKDQRYYGANSIETVWDELPAEQIPEAKKTVLFFEPAYESWRIAGNNVISVNDSHSELLDALRDQIEFHGDVFTIISSNLFDVLQGFSPPSNWTTDDEGQVEEMYLPQNAFSRDQHMEGLINTVSDFISSFEKRGDVRKEAIRILSEVDVPSLVNRWSDLLDPIEPADTYDIEPWTVNPGIIRDAYPPLALNPEELTEKSTADLEANATEPVGYKTEMSIEGGSMQVQLCPTESAFQTAVENLSTQTDVTELTVLLLPDDEEAIDWDRPQHASRLEELDLLRIGHVGGRRLWDFVLQLDEYMDNKGYSERISAELINETILQKEEKDEVRNTINALFNELDRLAKDISSNARADFSTAYSLDSAEGLIWEDKHLDTPVPFYANTGSAKTSRVGLAYGVVFSSKSFDESIEYSQLIDGVNRAYDRHFIDQNRFNYVYYLNQTYEDDDHGLEDRIIEVRRKYVDDTGDLKAPVLRLQRALGYLSDLNGQSPNELYDLLKSTDTEPNKIKILAGASASTTQATELFWGLLLDWSVQDSTEELFEDFERAQKDLSRLSSRIDEIEKQIEFMNRRFEPPGSISVDDVLNVRTKRIQEYQENISNVKNGFEKLVQQVREFPGLGSGAVVLWSVTTDYNELMSETVRNLQETLGGLDLYTNVNELKSEYNSFRSWLSATGNLRRLSIDKSELVEETEELGYSIFDFSTRVGKTEVPIEELDALEGLDSDIKSDLNRVENLNKRADSIDELSQNTDHLSTEIIDSLIGFGNRIGTVEDSP